MENELCKKKTTAPDTSVGADDGQPLHNSTENSISAFEGEINGDFQNSTESLDEIYRRMQRLTDPHYLHTISMTELYQTAYQSRPPIIDGLLYAGAYILAGAPKIGKSFLVAQIAYHVSTGKALWDYEVHPGMGVQMLVAGMITFVSLLGLAGDMGALETVVMIGVTLRFTTLLNDIVSSLFGMEDRRQMLNALDEVVDTAEMPSVTKTKGNPKNSDVSLNQVTFAYVKDKPVIRNISFTVPANKMFAIVGPSGCGKTTIIKLIARFYDVNGGNICIGDIDLRDFTTEDLFKQVSFVFQDVYLFNDSLKNNILMAKPDTSERELNEIADLAGVTEMIQRLPDGWNTLCGEGGRALSGGERQRVSIARALLKHAPIVLFDEATSALDAENETNIVRSIETLRKRSTLIVVAHKLETIQMADEIIVLNKEGHIAEVGSHEKLLAKNGAYKEFWDKRNASSQWKLA